MAFKLNKLKGTSSATSQIVEVFIRDTSSATGAGLASLVFNAGGLVAYWHRNTGSAGATQITLATMTVGTWATGGFIAVDNTNFPGLYQLGLPDTAVASGADSVSIYLSGATNMAPTVIELQLTGYDPSDSVRLGLTALPNVASGSSGAIPTTGTGSNQISVSSGQVIVQSGTGTGQLNLASGRIGINWADVTNPTTTLALTGTTISTSQIAASVTNGISVMNSGTAQAGSASTITLANSASAAYGHYVNNVIQITGGQGAGQARVITNYAITTRVATLDRDWVDTPDNTSTYQVIPVISGVIRSSGNVAVDSDDIRAGVYIGGWAIASSPASTTTNIYLGLKKIGNLGLVSTTNDQYVGDYLLISTTGGGDHSGMISRITAYDGATQKCTVSPAFPLVPSSVQESAWIIPHMNIDSNELTQGAVDVIVNSLNLSFFSVSGSVGSSGNSTTTVNLAGASSTNSMYVGQIIRVAASDIITAAASRVVSYVGSTNIATIYPALPFTPDNTYIYAITPDAPSLLQSGTGTGQVNLSSGRVGINWADVANPTTTVGLTGTTISTSQVAASVTGNVGGSVGSVASGGITAASIASSAITAAKFATDAVDANALATNAVTEIAGGILSNTSNLLATSASGAVIVQSGTGTGQLNLSSGRIGINWADVANPTTTVGLTGTTISTSQAVGSVTGAVGSVASGGITAASLASSTITAAKFATDAIDSNALAASAATEIANAVVAGGTVAILVGTVGATVSSTTATLTAGSVTDNIYNGNLLLIRGQGRLITAYNGTTKVATVTPAYVDNPQNGDSFTVFASAPVIVASGGIAAASIASSAITAAKFATDAIDANALATDAIDEIVLAIQGNLFIDGGIIGATNTLTTASINGLLTSTFDNTYNGQIIRIVSPGTARDGQTRTIVGYVGSTKTVTVSPGFNAIPSIGDIYAIYPSAPGQLTSEANTAIVDAIPTLYHADIALTKAPSTDEYTVTWFKNGVRVTSGITSPTIQVVKRSDGTDLVASTSMTQIGTTGSYKYDEGTNRMVAGQAYIALATASIDASSRSFSRVIGRDS